MDTQPNCPKCNSSSTYPDRALWVCPECAHEWTAFQAKTAMVTEDSNGAVRDAHGNALKDGDSVSIIKDLKVKGSTSGLKVGTKVKNIKIIDAQDGHNISCRVDGIGQMNLKSEFVKKSS